MPHWTQQSPTAQAPASAQEPSAQPQPASPSRRGYNPHADINPYKQADLKIVDCGDVPLMPVDNVVALEQMTAAMMELGSRRPGSRKNAGAGRRPRLLTLGGDHSVALGALRALRKVHGAPVAVMHFDAHLDTWKPPSSADNFPWFSEPGRFDHGDVFSLAWEEGLIENGSSVHVGLRTRLSGPQDIEEDSRQGFMQINCDEVDEVGTDRILERVRRRGWR